MSIETPKDRRDNRGRGFGRVGLERTREMQTIDRGARYKVESLEENKGIKC